MLHTPQTGFSATFMSLSEAPESPSSEWSQTWAGVLAVKQETGGWPSRQHPQYGVWLTKLCRQLYDKHHHRSYSGELTTERLSKLQRAGFPMDGDLPKEPPVPKKGGRVERVLGVLAAGGVPDKKDIAALRAAARRAGLSPVTLKQLAAAGLNLEE